MSESRAVSKPTQSKGRAVINAELCKGCQLCVAACPHQSIYITEDCNADGIHYAVFAPNNFCSACKFCAIICPDCAIQVYKFEREE